jgi:hypothetical protein
MDDQEGEMRYMVIEMFTKEPRPIYERAAKHGRMLPEGLTYLESWIDAKSLDRCLQLMETDDLARHHSNDLPSECGANGC